MPITESRFILTLVVSAWLSSCALTPPVVVDTTTSEAELAPYRQTGTASVKGQGFMRQKGGGVVTCAGAKAVLLPDIPAVRKFMAASRSGRRVEGSQKLDGVVRATSCDAQGNFRFDDLPAAKWIIATDVLWQVGNYQQGGGLAKSVSTSAGKTVEVLLTDSDLVTR